MIGVQDSKHVNAVCSADESLCGKNAEDVMQACFEAGVLPRQEGQSSHSHVLFGALANRNGLAVCDPPGWHLYGSQEAEVRACPGAEHELGLGLTEAMVRYAARHEYAWTVEDVLARRWRALFLDARQAMAMAPEVARILTMSEDLTGRSDGMTRYYVTDDPKRFSRLAPQFLGGLGVEARLVEISA